MEEVLQIVEADSKECFQILRASSGPRVGAVQGHSQGSGVGSAPPGGTKLRVEDTDLPPLAVHGTLLRHYPSIYRHGLRTGGHKHIHFATALPRDMPRSGMRSDSEVLLYLDVRAALADGVPVYLSQNRVVLTEGYGGMLPNRFISRVCVMVRGQEVEVESRAGALQSVDEAWRHLGSRRRPRSSAASKSWLSAQFCILMVLCAASAVTVVL